MIPAKLDVYGQWVDGWLVDTKFQGETNSERVLVAYDDGNTQPGIGGALRLMSLGVWQVRIKRTRIPLLEDKDGG